MQDITIFFVVMGILFMLYLFKRIFSPYRCSCGRSIWTGHGIAKHLMMKHNYIDPTKH